MGNQANVAYAAITAEATVIDPRLFLDGSVRHLWGSEDESAVLTSARSFLNKMSPILIRSVDYGSDGFCDISVDWHEWAITLYNHPELGTYLLDRSATPSLPG